MDSFQELLFGRFPREGSFPVNGDRDLTRFTLFTAEHFETFVDETGQDHNVYASVGWLPPQGPVFDKVFYDLDAKPGDVFPGDMTEAEMFDVMRSDPDTAEAVLGAVVEDMHALADASLADGIPIVGVYTGMGVHVHQLFQSAHIPIKELKSTAEKYIDELGLQTVDSKPVGDVMRVGKIPNTQRREAGQPTGVWTIPLTSDELRMLSPHDLVELSSMPRAIEPVIDHERPEMQVHKEHLRTNAENTEPVPIGESGDVPSDVEWLLDRLLSMPCVKQRAMSRDPNHLLRQELAVKLFNRGFSVDDAHAVIRKLNWADYNYDRTQKQLRQIYRKKYGERSCSSMRGITGKSRENFCVHRDDPKACPAHGWQGGTMDY